MCFPASSALLALALALLAVTAPGVRAGRAFNATAVMHTPLGRLDMGPQEIVAVNLEAYEQYLAAGQSDLVVYPESGTGYLFVPRDQIPGFCEPVPVAAGDVVPCPTRWNGTTPHLSWASCAARRFGTVIVINYCERSGPAEENRLFNVVVAVDSAGRLLGKYRKAHISGTGPYLSQPAEPDAVVFQPTPWGEPFGAFVCYDVWFARPQQDLIRQGVRHFVAPSQLGNGAPYWTVSQVHNGWSLAEQITLVTGSSMIGGSAGIYVNGTAGDVVGPIPAPVYTPHREAVTCTVPVDPSEGSSPHNCRRSPGPVGGPNLSPAADSAVAAALSTGVVAGGTVARAAAAAPPAPVTSAAETCMYGPAQYNLNFTTACQVVPAVQAGQSGSLSVDFTGAFGSVQCRAAYTVREAAPAPLPLVLMAFVIVVEPTPDTPTATANAGCVLLSCADPYKQGCLSLCPDDDPWCPLWNVTTGFSNVTVDATFGGNFTAATTVPFPLALVRRDTAILPLGKADVNYAANGTAYHMHTDGAACPGCPFYSFGFWATALYKSL